jgi:UDP:flavonoid glycosyltransferase YjiC (YdhE family)
VGVANEWITGVVGVAGLVATYLTAARGRDQVERMTLAGQKHERKMTREAREQDRIAGAYIGLLRMTERIGQWAQLVNPMYQPNPDRPHSDLEAQADVRAEVRAYGSDEVVEAFEAWQKVVTDMIAAVRLIERDPSVDEPYEALRHLQPLEVEKHKALVRQINKESRPRG